MKKGIQNHKGYTLVELIFTMAILLVIAIPISSMFVVSHENNREAEQLQEGTLLGQKVLESYLSKESIEDPLSEDLKENPPVLQSGIYSEFKVQTVVQPIQHDIAIEKDSSGNSLTEKVTPVEVIVGNTGKSYYYQLPLDAGVALSQVDTEVKPVASAVENYQYEESTLELRSTNPLRGMDEIFYLEPIQIRRSAETEGTLGQDIFLSFDPVEASATHYKMSVSYGTGLEARQIPINLSLVGLDEINKQVRIAFVIENDNTPRRIRLLNQPTFQTDLYVVRGIKDKDADVYYSGVGTGTSEGQPLVSLTYGQKDGHGSFLDNDPKLASGLLQMRGYFQLKNERQVRTSRLYEIRVLVYKATDDETVAKPIVELRTYRRSVL